MVRVKYGQRRFILQGGHQVGLQGGPHGVLQGVLHGVKVFRWTQEEVIWVRNGQGWFQLKFKGSI